MFTYLLTMFLSYLPQNSADSDESWHIVSWINLLQSIKEASRLN